MQRVVSALLAGVLANLRTIFCCIAFETTLTDLMSPCELSFESCGRFGIEYDHLKSSGLIESWR